MSIHDSIADALTIIRNGTMANKHSVEVKFSNKIFGIIKILKEEGYIEKYNKFEAKDGKYQKVRVVLKYRDKKSVIDGIERVSKPGLRMYSPVSEMPRILNGFGTAIVSTSKGIMTDRKARMHNVGGEVLCKVW